MRPTSTMSKTTRPSNLGPAGRALSRWLTHHFDIEPCLPAIQELCRCADVLETARTEYARALAAGDDTQALRWASAVSKAEAGFARLWRLCGLHKAEYQAPAIKDKRR